MEDQLARIITELSDDNKLSNHIPDEVWELSRDNEVYIRDEKTGELIQIIDFTDDTNKERAPVLCLRNQKKKS